MVQANKIWTTVTPLPTLQTRVGSTNGDESSIRHLPNNSYLRSRSRIRPHASSPTATKQDSTRLYTTRHATAEPPHQINHHKSVCISEQYLHLTARTSQ